jgi:hypothetical protein
MYSFFSKENSKEWFKVEAWKIELGKKALEAGIMKDPQWLDRLDEPMPLWVLLELAFMLIEKLDPPTVSYD